MQYRTDFSGTVANDGRLIQPDCLSILEGGIIEQAAFALRQ